MFCGVSGLCGGPWWGGGVAEEVENINWLAAGGGARGSGGCGSERTVIPPNVPYRNHLATYPFELFP